MHLPAYWLPRPEARPDRATVASFDRLLGEARDRGPDRAIDYQLAAPKWQFLSYAADHGGVVLHGSGDPSIERFEPRQPDDTLEFSSRRAIFAATDGIWPMYYAILDREHHPMMLCNSCIRMCFDRRMSDPYYFFSISRPALQLQPWRTGTVYLLSADTFEFQPRIAVEDSLIEVAQAASPLPVKPVAKISVLPSDFPFLDRIRGHDDEVLAARMSADPDGFPWFEER